MKIRIMVGLIKICVNMDEEKSREKQGKTKGRGRGGKKRREKSQLSETHISPTLTSTAWCLLTFAIFFFQIALSGIMVLVGVLCSYFNTIVSALIINFVDWFFEVGVYLFQIQSLHMINKLEGIEIWCGSGSIKE